MMTIGQITNPQGIRYGDITTGAEYSDEPFISPFNDPNIHLFQLIIGEVMRMASLNGYNFTIYTILLLFILFPFVYLCVDLWFYIETLNIPAKTAAGWLSEEHPEKFKDRQLDLPKFTLSQRIFLKVYVFLRQWDIEEKNAIKKYGIRFGFLALFTERAVLRHREARQYLESLREYWFGGYDDFKSAAIHFTERCVKIFIGILTVYILLLILFALFAPLILPPVEDQLQFVNVVEPKINITAGINGLKDVLYGSMFIFMLYAIVGLLFALIAVAVVIRKSNKK